MRKEINFIHGAGVYKKRVLCPLHILSLGDKAYGTYNCIINCSEIWYRDNTIIFLYFVMHYKNSSFNVRILF